MQRSRVKTYGINNIGPICYTLASVLTSYYKSLYSSVVVECIQIAKLFGNELLKRLP